MFSLGLRQYTRGQHVKQAPRRRKPAYYLPETNLDEQLSALIERAWEAKRKAVKFRFTRSDWVREALRVQALAELGR